MDDLKISFKVEVTKCWNCPYGIRYEGCEHEGINPKDQRRIHEQNQKGLTKTCPMVRAQFEALE